MEDPFVTCPFFKNHKIVISRLKFHLLKCAKNHSMTGITICPYNSDHIINAAETLDHCSTCPDIQTLLFPANNCESKTSLVLQDLHCPYSESLVHTTRTTEIDHADTNTIKESNIKPSRVIVKNEPTSEMSLTASNIGHEENRKTKKGLDSKYINSLLCDRIKSLTYDDIDYAEVYRQLEALEREEIIVEKKIRDIKEQKQSLIEILKTIALKRYNLTPSNENINSHISVDNNDENNSNDVCTNTNLNYKFDNECNEQFDDASKKQLVKEPEQDFGINPLVSSTNAGVQEHNSTQRFGRGIANAYKKTKNSQWNFNYSERYYNSKNAFQKNYK